MARRAEVQGWLDSWAELARTPPAATPSARVAVLTGLDTKGLEFDGIVVVQPEEIEAESATGRATLYVVLTRATQRMVTVTVDGRSQRMPGVTAAGSRDGASARR